ncbi:hypothetical protein [Hydrogenophaga sp.]|uniref:hypothetical protein n=1 Tax=Hydrogenophaga sp. TaxID=1904254 RepID=UPI0025C1E044|nr:hypothetical protein [Hydrogenophaga sp.]MDO9131571.1 hypothetical protein [Hydrogenophaga sp.]MDO9505447.1 hypothetical protein [Hydrogenophaga sp.]MDP2248793.1 hypothetical protein [Hydrogenophaga sp.]MDP2987324.1 hypothetical protein [Hydrogenophaga sp.]MDP3628524.1 hypothetical protein [Hydrogenophaga sp.]
MNLDPHSPPLRGSLPPEGAEPPSGGRAAARLWQRALVWMGVIAILLGTLTLYNQPGFLVNLADQLWSCF